MFQKEPSVAVTASNASGAAISAEPYWNDEQVRVIKPGSRSLKSLVLDLWRSRELIFFLTWRDVKVKYKQTVLGVLWAILQPVISMVVLSVVFGRFNGITNLISRSTPYPIFLYSGMLPWNFFASMFSSSSSSVIGNSGLFMKVRFPRFALPLTAAAGETVDFCLSFIVFLGLMIGYHVPFTFRMLIIPFLMLGICTFALGLGAIFASLIVKYRDFRFIIPFLIQIWMFLTPIIYPPKYLTGHLRLVLSLNPMNGWVGGFRTALLGGPFHWRELAASAGISCVMLLLGVFFFQATERRFAEVV